ncbi:MAG TPA: AbrB/MazE/SpoVT family DNA-binding domain-containing protein [Stellaceae bacterium]|nr:AbrB/MazE/SpoVT family DNA-binding domain-containing protein [Stellaceae bacterium]
MTKMTTKGQVTIPKRVRDRLGLKPGCNIDFDVEGERILLMPATKLTPKQSRFAKLRGSRKTGMTTEQWMTLLRGDER